MGLNLLQLLGGDGSGKIGQVDEVSMMRRIDSDPNVKGIEDAFALRSTPSKVRSACTCRHLAHLPGSQRLACCPLSGQPLLAGDSYANVTCRAMPGGQPGSE